MSVTHPSPSPYGIVLNFFSTAYNSEDSTWYEYFPVLDTPFIIPSRCMNTSLIKHKERYFKRL